MSNENIYVNDGFGQKIIDGQFCEKWVGITKIFQVQVIFKLFQNNFTHPMLTQNMSGENLEK